MRLRLRPLERGHMGTLQGGNLPGPDKEPWPQPGHTPRARPGPLSLTPILTGPPGHLLCLPAGGVPAEPRHSQTDTLCVLMSLLCG